MKAQTLAKHFQPTRIERYHVFAFFSKNWSETSSAGGEHAGLNLMQKVFALADELAMAGKSMAGAV